MAGATAVAQVPGCFLGMPSQGPFATKDFAARELLQECYKIAVGANLATPEHNFGQLPLGQLIGLAS